MTTETGRPRCMVCQASDVPMSVRVTDARLPGGDLCLCDDPEWCQVRAAANVIESLGLPVEIEREATP